MLIFKVRVMLAAHDCAEGFWMGNLKHKNVAGIEVSSQMQAAEKKKAGGKGKRKRQEEEEEEEEEGDEEAADE